MANAVQELASLLLEGTYLTSYKRDHQFGSPLQKDRRLETNYARRLSVSDIYLNGSMVPRTRMHFRESRT